MPIIKQGYTEGHHDCTTGLPSPREVLLGTVAECDGCGRRWKMDTYGVTYRQWRRTFRTAFRDDMTRSRGFVKFDPAPRWEGM